MNPQQENKSPVTYDIFKNKDYLIDVVTRCQAGDVKAMEIIYEGYKLSLYNLAFRYANNHFSAEDLLQDIFIKVFQNIDKLRTAEAFNGWLYRTAVNTCISYTRKKGRVKQSLIDENAIIDESVSPPVPIRQDIENAIANLTPSQKAIFLLHDVQGFTHGEITEVMGCSQGTSKSQLFRARMRIRKYLKDSNI